MNWLNGVGSQQQQSVGVGPLISYCSRNEQISWLPVVTRTPTSLLGQRPPNLHQLSAVILHFPPPLQPHVFHHSPLLVHELHGKLEFYERYSPARQQGGARFA
jgi:hypothetical protein